MGRITITLDNRVHYDLKKRAAKENNSVSALSAGLIESALLSQDTDTLHARIGQVLARLEHTEALVEAVMNRTGKPPKNEPDTASETITPTEMKAFFLETLLCLRGLYKNDLTTYGNIVGQVKKYYGEGSRVKGL